MSAEEESKTTAEGRKARSDIKAALARLVRNNYVVSVLVFLVWMMFVDEDNMVARYEYSRKISELETEKAQLKEQIEQDRRKMKELMSNKTSLEKFAREEYYMKRDDEVIFIIK